MLQKTVYKDGHTRSYALVAEQLSVLNKQNSQSQKDGRNPNQSPSGAGLSLSSRSRNFASLPQSREVLKMAVKLAKLTGNI